MAEPSPLHATRAALLGKRVRVTLDTQVVQEGILLGFGDGGDFELRQDDGFVWHGWPMLEVAEVPAVPDLPGPAGNVTVTMTVTIFTTGAQWTAYQTITDSGFAGLDVAARIRSEALEALNLISWLRECATITVSEPQVQASAGSERGT